MEIRTRDVRNYITLDGREIFREWLASVKDDKDRAIVRTRIDRLLLGNFGDYKRFAGDLYELRIHHGAGYRIYCGGIDSETIILLCGGIKRTQKRDIKKAKEYWQELKTREL